MNKSESKYFNTARLMNKALLELLENKLYDYITIKEVCEKAGVNRSTFYLHYENMSDLLSESISYIIETMDNKFDDENKLSKKEIEERSLEELILISPKYLMPYLEFVRENKKIFTAVISQPIAFNTNEIFNKMYDDVFSPILDRFQISDEERKYRLSFYLNGIYAVILEWIKSGCIDSTEYIAELLIKCINFKTN